MPARRRHYGKEYQVYYLLNSNLNIILNLFFTGVIGYNKQLVNPDDLQKHYGKVTDTGTTIRESGGNPSAVFYLSRPDDDINIDLIRIEKAGQAILSEDEWKGKKSALIYTLGFLVACPP